MEITELSLSSSSSTIRHMMNAQVFRAAEEGDVDILGRYDSEQVGTALLTATKNTILHVHLNARTEQSTEAVVIMLSKWPFLGSQANDKGVTPLHLAVRYGHTNISRLLLDHAKSAGLPDDSVERESEGMRRAREMMRRTNEDGDSALHEAVRCGHSGMVALLVREEDEEFTYAANRAEESLLYMAAERGQIQIAWILLIDFKSPAYHGPNGRTAAHVAAIRDEIDMMAAILNKQGLDHLTKEVDDKGWTPLHYAAYNLSEMVVKWLLGFDKSAAYVSDHLGKTALHIAATRQGNLSTIHWFLIYCPDSFEVVDHRGRNVLHFAAESGSEHAVSVILEKSSLRHLINVKDKDGNTPLHLMLAAGNFIPKLLKDSRVDMMVFNNNHLNPLDLISSTKDYTLLEMKELEASVNPESVGLRVVSKLEEAHKQDRNTPTETKSEQISDSNEVGRLKGILTEAHLLVATLIATVTFAAGVSMPGGYSQDQGTDLGLAILSPNTAFKAFVISDSIALVLSCTAVFIYLVVAMNRNNKIAGKMFAMALPLTLYALLAMVVAFITGTYAVLPHNSFLAYAACVVGCLFFLLYAYIYGMAVLAKISQGLIITFNVCVNEFVCCLCVCSDKN